MTVLQLSSKKTTATLANLSKDKYDTRDIRSNNTCNSKSNILAPRNNTKRK